MHRPGDSSEAAEGRLLVWSFVWASALLFALTANPGWFFFLAESFPGRALVWEEIGLATLALSVVVFPGRPGLLALLAAAQVLQVGLLLPEVSNHRLILAFVNLSLLAAWLSRAAVAAGPRARAEALWSSFLPAARAIVVVVYAFAFLAKLNGGFLDPAVSCGTRFYGHITDTLPFLPQGPSADLAVIYGTVLAEGLIPLFLLVPRLRTAGVALGLLFHLGLSFDQTKHFVNFSAVMSALLVLFLPDGYFERLGAAWRARRSAMVRLGVAAAFLVLIAIGLATAVGSPWGSAYFGFRQTFWTLYAGALVATVVCFAPGAASARPRFGRAGPLQWAVVGLVVLNGLSPYLGLKTRTAFNMYSNLVLEADRSNHLFVGPSLDLLGFLSDRVAVVSSTDERLQRELASTGREVTWFEFSTYVAAANPVEVVYRRNGKLRRVRATDPERPEPPPAVLRKVLVFQTLGPGAERECLW